MQDHVGTPKDVPLPARYSATPEVAAETDEAASLSSTPPPPISPITERLSLLIKEGKDIQKVIIFLHVLIVPACGNVLTQFPVLCTEEACWKVSICESFLYN